MPTVPPAPWSCSCVAAFIEPDLGRGRDDIVPAKVVGGDERAGIGKIAAGQNGDGFFPGRGGPGGGEPTEAAAPNKIAIVRPKPTVEAPLAPAELQGAETARGRALSEDDMERSSAKKTHAGGVRFRLN